MMGCTLSPMARRDLIIADILMENDMLIDHRLEWMAAQALLTGKVVVSGEDYPEDAPESTTDLCFSLLLA